MLKKTTKNNEIYESQNNTVKHDHKNIYIYLYIYIYIYPLKPIMIILENKYDSLNKMKIHWSISEVLFGWGSAITASTLSLISPNICIVISSTTAL